MIERKNRHLYMNVCMCVDASKGRNHTIKLKCIEPFLFSKPNCEMAKHACTHTYDTNA